MHVYESVLVAVAFDACIQNDECAWNDPHPTTSLQHHHHIVAAVSYCDCKDCNDSVQVTFRLPRYCRLMQAGGEADGRAAAGQ